MRLDGDFDLRDAWREKQMRLGDPLRLKCFGSIGSPQKSSSSQTATNQQVATSGSGTAIGAKAVVGGSGSGPTFSVGDNSSRNSLAYTNTQGGAIVTVGAKGSYSSYSSYVDNSTDANDALAFDTIDQLETAAANGSAQSLLQAQQGTSGTSGTGAAAPTYVVTGGAGDGATGGGFSLTPMNAILLAGAALALIYIFKR